MLRFIGRTVNMILRVPPLGWLAQRWLKKVRVEAKELSGITRARYFAVHFELLGVPPVAGAAISESLESGITVAAGLARNERPYCLFIVAPSLPHASRRAVYEELRSQIDRAIVDTIVVP